MDAPYHFISAGRTINQIEIADAIGNAVVFRFIDKDANERVSIGMVQRYLETNGIQLRSGDFALFHLWAGPRDDPARHSVGALDEDLARWLVDCGIRLVGLDLASVDQGTGRAFPAHVALLGANVLIVENLVNMRQLPQARVEFYAVPLLLDGGTGSPVRAFARIESLELSGEK